MEVLRCDEVLGGAMGPPAVVVVVVVEECWGWTRDVFRAES